MGFFGIDTLEKLIFGNVCDKLTIVCSTRLFTIAMILLLVVQFAILMTKYVKRASHATNAQRIQGFLLVLISIGATGFNLVIMGNLLIAQRVGGEWSSIVFTSIWPFIIAATLDHQRIGTPLPDLQQILTAVSTQIIWFIAALSLFSIPSLVLNLAYSDEGISKTELVPVPLS